ncbi:MAG TPA: energy transducer TonB [Terriglobales bacterium]|nr:energy transducer TonB [Terriglobales bacterium]
MPFGSEEAVRHRWNLPVTVSIALHLVLLALAVRSGAEPIFVTPSSVARGDGLKSYRLLYFSPVGADSGQPIDHRDVTLQAPTQQARTKPPKSVKEKKSVSREGEVADRSVKAGMPFGSLLYGPSSGHDVRPAYPIVFPDPRVANADLPSGVAGEVIVEVTIDELGHVIETKLLAGIGHGIDEKVLAALQNWRFRPALMDGRPIASKHDVHFRFPS